MTALLKQSTFVFMAALLLALFLFSGSSIYPVPGGDTSAYTQSAVEYAQTGELTARYLDDGFIHTVDPSGQRRFLLYPPLHQYIIGKILNIKTSDRAFFAIALIHYSTLLLYVATALLVTWRIRKSIRWADIILITISTLFFASVLFGNAGRPESFAHLLLTLGVILSFIVPSRFLYAFFGVILGVLAALHPMAAALAALGIGLFFSASMTFAMSLKNIFFSYLIALGVTLGIFIVLPTFPIQDLIRGIYNHAIFATQQSNTNSIDVWRTFITNAHVPLIGIPILCVLISLVRMLRRETPRKNFHLLLNLYLFLCFLFLVYLFTRMSIYYLYLFLAPVGLLLILNDLVRTSSVVFKYVVGFILSLSLIGLGRSVLLIPFFLNDGLSINEARAELKNLFILYPQEKTPYVISKGLWVLFRDYRNTFGDDSIPRALRGSDFILLKQENYSGSGFVPDSSSFHSRTCKRVANHFRNKSPKILGVTLAHTTPGYGFAAYHCSI